MGLTYCLCVLFFQQYERLIGSQYKSIELAKSDWVTQGNLHLGPLIIGA
jgi:hypothetical protein